MYVMLCTQHDPTIWLSIQVQAQQIACENDVAEEGTGACKLMHICYTIPSKIHLTSVVTIFSTFPWTLKKYIYIFDTTILLFSL